MVQDGILTSMKLLHNNLNGDVGMVLAKLGELQSVGGVCALQELNLASNRCRGKLPGAAFAKLPSLVVCCLPFNEIEGSIPEAIVGASSSLVVLNLQANRLTGSIPVRELRSFVRSFVRSFICSSILTNLFNHSLTARLSNRPSTQGESRGVLVTARAAPLQQQVIGAAAAGARQAESLSGTPALG